MKRKMLILAIASATYSVAFAQMKIGGTGSPSDGAMLELESSDKGFTLPRINLTSLTMALNGTVPADGMVVYSTNTLLGTGLFAWYNNTWNKVLEKSRSSTNARFLARAQTIGNRLQWDPLLIQQPEGSLPIWYDTDPTKITIRNGGMYIVSAGFRKEAVNEAGLTIYVNGQTVLYSSQYGYGNNYMNPNGSLILYLAAGDILTIGQPIGNVVTVLGTSQLSICQLPFLSY